jgi:hypothetical protein
MLDATHVIYEDIILGMVALLENPDAQTRTNATMMLASIANASDETTTLSDEIYEHVILGMVVLLGNADTQISANATTMLIGIANASDEAPPLSDETILQIVTHVNNPSEDISQLATNVLFGFSQHGISLSLVWRGNLTDSIRDAIQARLSHHDTILKFTSLMESSFIHVRCCGVVIFAFLVDEGKSMCHGAWVLKQMIWT